MSEPWTEERRRKASERMKKQWTDDPEYAARARDALRRGNRKRWDERRPEDLERLFYQRCDPRYIEFARLRLKDPRQAEAHRKLLKMLNTDPVIIDRRKEAIKKKWTDPQFRARMAEKNRRTSDKRRGFRVPKTMWAEYRRLTKTKLLSAREAGIALGLVVS